jgi:DNA-binding beta-propeller fold protein YncE
MIKMILFICCLGSAGLTQPVLVELGRFGGTGAAPGKFTHPCAIDISADGRLFICDQGNQRIQIFDLFGKFLINIGGFGWSPEKFDQPLDIWARSTINIYVADYNNQRVQRFDKDLNFIGEKRSNPADRENFQFREVLSTAYSSQGDLFVLDAGENKVIKFNNRDQGDAAFGYYESGRGELIGPVQLELSTDHRVIVSDSDARAIFIFDYFGNFLFKIEHPEFKQPRGLALDRNNRIYVADPESGSIHEFTPSGKFLNVYRRINGIPFSTPIDLAIHETEKQTRFYIIDGDEIIITERVAVSPKE